MKRWLWIAILVALVAVVAISWRRGLRDGHVSKLGVQEADRSTPVGSSTTNSPHIVANESEMSDRDDPAKIRRAIEMGNVAINFWGKIVDQDGAPLPGVTIIYTYAIHHGNDLGVAWMEREERKGEIVSDGSGSFAITGLTGHDLVIESLSKPGYMYRMRHSLTYDFGGNMPERRFQSRQDEPVRFAMVNEGTLERLIHKRGRINVSGTGTPGPWNLWEGEPDPNGELIIMFRREPAVLKWSDRLSTWSADLQIVGGELIEALWEEDVHRAPASGYSATVPYPKQPQKEGVGVRSFYLRTANGNYGRIQVELYPGDDGPTARCFITSDMNPRSGSRNLEPAEE